MKHRTFIILDDEDLERLQNARLAYCYIGDEQFVILSEKGYEELEKFFGENEEGIYRPNRKPVLH